MGDAEQVIASDGSFRRCRECAIDVSRYVVADVEFWVAVFDCVKGEQDATLLEASFDDCIQVRASGSHNVIHVDADSQMLYMFVVGEFKLSRICIRT